MFGRAKRANLRAGRPILLVRFLDVFRTDEGGKEFFSVWLAFFRPFLFAKLRSARERGLEMFSRTHFSRSPSGQNGLRRCSWVFPTVKKGVCIWKAQQGKSQGFYWKNEQCWGFLNVRVVKAAWISWYEDNKLNAPPTTLSPSLTSGLMFLSVNPVLSSRSFVELFVFRKSARCSRFLQTEI